MTLVIDASVAVKWLVREEGTDAARELLAAPDPMIAPDWLLIEAGSTFWRKVERSELLAVHAERHLAVLPTFFQRLAPSAELVADALQLAIRLRHSIYHCLYLALAIAEDAQLVTADRRFYDASLAAGMAERPRLLT